MSPGTTSSLDVLLVGYENQENIGLRSIMAYLRKHGYRVMIAPFYPGHDDLVLQPAQEYKPRLVGFSLIFQYTIDDFAALMRRLRQHGVEAHFTAGGHFPSLRPHETLKLIPELDTIVRFEGELTLLELLERLDTPEQWKSVAGLAYRNGSEVQLTAPRPLISDLDSLPFIYRDESWCLEDNGLKVAAMLASRGCLYDCSFCSIRQFYGNAPGLLRRVRSPQAVVNEMLSLFTEKGVRFFSFQDDDFAMRTRDQRQWLRSFLDALVRAGLKEQIRWKISCRVDDLEPEILERMIEHGLIAVYLGVESGSEAGLRTLNKRSTVAQNRAAIELLKRHNLVMAMGFMLLDPSSSVETIRENINFLRDVGEDGYFATNFCKMLPYAGTPIEAELRLAGRLKGTAGQPYYGFLDPNLDCFDFLVKKIFHRRNFTVEGNVALLQDASFNFRLAASPGNGGLTEAVGAVLRRLITRSNRTALETLETLLEETISQGSEALLAEQETVMKIAEREWNEEMIIEAELRALKTAAIGESLCLTAGIGIT